MNIIFFGPPGAGKGTQAEIISKDLSIPTISTGAMLREAMKNGTEMGKAAKSYIESGALVPDEVVTGILKDRISEKDCAGGFILDGFPRTIPQAESLDAMGVKIDVVLSLEVADEVIVERLGGRRLCSNCGLPYHIVYNPSKDGKTCDKCGGALNTRKDDDPSVVKSRLNTYHKETEPLKAYYSAKKLVKAIDGTKDVAEITRLIKAALE